MKVKAKMKAWKPEGIEATEASVSRRGEGRTRVLMSAKIISSTGSHSVLVREASTGGAQIYTDMLAEGDDACFSKGAVFVAAQVVWSKRGVAGLQFYRELSASELSAEFPSPVKSDRRRTPRIEAS